MKNTFSRLTGWILFAFFFVPACISDCLADSPNVEYGEKGLEITSADGNNRVQIQWRLQFRYSYPFEEDPLIVEEFEAEERSDFDIRRARLKVGGHAYRPWLKYYLEYDFPGTNLLDWRFTFENREDVQVRIGQWKANFNRERVASSGEQQFAERSLVNEFFTIDRQKGAMVMGHLYKDTYADSWYHVGVFSGAGIGGDPNDDEAMMWLVRYQWNFLKQDLEQAQSDAKNYSRPAASLAAAWVTNRSPYTKFSSSGGGQLPGFENGEAGQYSITQWLQESAFKYSGFSFQQEYHWKEIEDNKNLVTTNLQGAYFQSGYFFHHLIPAIPRQLEIAGRYAFVDQNTNVENDLLKEYSAGLNWFIREHRNKLTLDWSRISKQQPSGDSLQDSRVRFQWDVSF